jgi:glycine C-acetyltransferase
MASIKVLEILTHSDRLRKKLKANTEFFRTEIAKLGFTVLPGTHPIVPIMLGEANLAQEMARRLLEKGIYVIGFSFPVVPRGKARIRTQISAAHSMEDLLFALEKFAEVKKEMGL